MEGFTYLIRGQTLHSTTIISRKDLNETHAYTIWDAKSFQWCICVFLACILESIGGKGHILNECFGKCEDTRTFG